MRYLITGHTGFKGSWLALMLDHLGHEVSGISLDPDPKSLFNDADLSSLFVHDFRSDIRNRDEISKLISICNPEIIIHLAAQPLVRLSYEIPIETFDTNVMGTLNVLEASRGLSDLRAILVITTDKVYKNFGHLRGYVEEDQLGGDDPYSASKAAADLAVQSWIKSFGTLPVSIARAGNVIGGGDWAKDRLIPDLVISYLKAETPVVRNPNSIRPWQHVLDCLNGYLTLVDSMLNDGLEGNWNFGPDHNLKFSVSQVIDEFATHFEMVSTPWKQDLSKNPVESELLLLDSSKARNQLRWTEILSFEHSLAWTAAWYLDAKAGGARSITQKQIADYFEMKNMKSESFN